MNSFGNLFRITLYGASHESEVGVIIDGCLPGLALSVNDFTEIINRRKPTATGGTLRNESDTPELRSGIYQGFTTGAPLNISFRNRDVKSEDYNFDGFYRPGHADYTASVKYQGYSDPRGGGIFSGRMTLPLVAAGVVALKMLQGISVSAELVKAGGSTEIHAAVQNASQHGDSVGGVVKCEICGVPAGWGEPFFDSVESLLSHLLFSVPGIRAISFGDGVESADMLGSEFNDVFIGENGETATNHSGGINGGITNGNNLIFSVYCKPTSSITKGQQTFNFTAKEMSHFSVPGRHDVCFALRIPVIIEAAAAIVLADLKLLHFNNCCR
ncbi:MAG: chorismate synthase [Bacteroidales bacterium]|nr:chorismate synthase [Bacteroidales bacterium]